MSNDTSQGLYSLVLLTHKKPLSPSLEDEGALSGPNNIFCAIICWITEHSWQFQSRFVARPGLVSKQHGGSFGVDVMVTFMVLSSHTKTVGGNSEEGQGGGKPTTFLCPNCSGTCRMASQMTRITTICIQYLTQTCQGHRPHP